MKAILYSLSCLLCAYAQVIGIDFGNEFMKVALVSQGKTLVIIENTTTKRKTENMISFYLKERKYEADAANKRTRNSKNTFCFLNKFIGKLATDQQTLTISKQNLEDYAIEQNPDDGSFQFRIENFQLQTEEYYEEEGEEQQEKKQEEQIFEDNKIVLKVEEIVAMILQYAKKLVYKQFQIDVDQTVITVPSNWGINQRLALNQAAKIAGLEVLGLMNENTAAALYYALDRKDNSTHRVIFYNMGSYHISATLAEYVAINHTVKQNKLIESVKIIAHETIDNVGGIAYDRTIAQILAKKIEKKTGSPPTKKQQLKLLKASNSLKEVLSANKDTPVFIEGILDGDDFSSHLTREEFENEAKPLFEKIMIPIEKVLEKNEQKDLNIIELIGGGIRVPKIQQILQENYKDIGTHLNGDECMALGAAFYAANMSKIFRVRPVHVYDWFNLDIFMEIYNEDNLLRKQKIFEKGDPLGLRKNITFENNKDLNITFSLDNDKYLTYHLMNISNITEHKNLTNLGIPTTLLEIELSSAQYVKIRNQMLLLNETIEVEINTSAKNSTKNDKKKNEKKNKKKKNETKEEDEGEEENKEEGNKEKENKKEEKTEEEKKEKGNAQQIELNTTDTQNATEKQKEYKNITHQIPIQVDVTNHYFKSLTQQELDKAQKKLKLFDISEQKQYNLSEIKNKLEGFIYHIREIKDLKDFHLFSKAEERERLVQQAEEHARFIENIDGPVKFRDYKKRHDELVEIMTPMYIRLEEAKARPKAINDTIDQLKEVQKKINAVQTTMPWITESDLQPVIDQYNNFTSWLRESLDKQEKQELNEDPVFLLKEIKEQFELITKQYSKLRTISKPKRVRDLLSKLIKEKKQKENNSEEDEQKNEDEMQNEEKKDSNKDDDEIESDL